MAKTLCIEDSANSGTIGRVGWFASPKHIHKESDWYLRWLIGTKHFPESKTVLDSGSCFVFWEVFLRSGKCFGSWNVFWTLGCTFISGKCFRFWEVFCLYEPWKIWQWFTSDFCNDHSYPCVPCIWRPAALSQMSHTWCPQDPESPHMSQCPLYSSPSFIHSR